MCTRIPAKTKLFSSRLLEKSFFTWYWNYSQYINVTTVYLQLFANETNDPGLFSYCDVIITVVNENDNAPVFDRIEYIVNVSEKGT